MVHHLNKMYSNNILNFQESTTILNTCTKIVWKLIDWFGGFYGISTSVGYLTPNPFLVWLKLIEGTTLYIYIYIYIKLLLLLVIYIKPKIISLKLMSIFMVTFRYQCYFFDLVIYLVFAYFIILIFSTKQRLHLLLRLLGVVDLLINSI